MAIKTYRHVRTDRVVRAVEGSRLAKLLAKDDGYKAESGKGGTRSSSKSDDKSTSSED